MAEEKGLYAKYRVLKADGSPVNDFKFVLSPETDPDAREALRIYAYKTKNESLSEDIFAWLAEIEKEAE